MKALSIVIFSFVLVGLGLYWFFSHSGYVPFSHNPMQYMPNMHHSQALKPQRDFALNPTGSGAFVPPKGTLARERGNHSKPQPMPYKYDLRLRGESIPPEAGNPFEKTRANILRGKQIYGQYCVVCHGPKGLGNGNVVGPFPRPPALVTEKLEKWADNQIYHVIMAGQNQMYPYAHAIREEDRWKLIHYVRVLQKAYNPTENDLEAFDDFVKAEDK